MTASCYFELCSIDACAHHNYEAEITMWHWCFYCACHIHTAVVSFVYCVAAIGAEGHWHWPYNCAYYLNYHIYYFINFTMLEFVAIIIDSASHLHFKKKCFYFCIWGLQSGYASNLSKTRSCWWSSCNEVVSKVKSWYYSQCLD